MCIILVITLTICSISASALSLDDGYLMGTYTTAYNEVIAIGYWVGGEVGDYPYMTHFINEDGSSRVCKISEADYTYNCYTYAFIYDGHDEGVFMLDDNDVFHVDNPQGFLVQQNPCLTQISFSNAQVGDMVVYKNDGGSLSFNNSYSHVALITEKNSGSTMYDVKVKSKWREYDIYEHGMIDCPYAPYYNGHTDIELCNNIDQSVTIELTFFAIDHNYEYTAIIVPPVRPTLPSSSTYHYAECNDCGAYHYGYHDYASSTCSKCGYYTGISINSNDQMETQ